jgi:hypothetical protein
MRRGAINSNLAIEMTWGETAATQAKGKKTSLKESSCFRLRSIDLSGTA